MRDAGHALEYRYPTEGDALPEPEGYAGVVVFGGRWSANDCGSEPWIPRELAFLERCLATDTPLFGVCLGAQLLARVLGARVGPHVDGLREIGFHRVDPVPGAEGFLAEPLTVMQWHSEGFDTPPGLRAGGHLRALPRPGLSRSGRASRACSSTRGQPRRAGHLARAQTAPASPGDLDDDQRARCAATRSRTTPP